MKVHKKINRLVCLLVALCCFVSMMATGAFATNSENANAVDTEEYVVVPIYDSFQEAELAVKQQMRNSINSTSADYGYVYPYLARASSSSTTVYFNIAYSGSYSPTSFSYSSLKVQNLLNINYASYGSGSASFSRTNAYIGAITIPTGKSSALVKGSGLSIKISGYWHTVSNVSGTWTIY
mgnify:CR=1 FL=1